MNNFVNNLTCCTTSILPSPCPYPTKIKVNISGGEGRFPSADILRQSMLREKSRTTEQSAARIKLHQRTTHAIQETPYVTSRRMIP